MPTYVHKCEEHGEFEVFFVSFAEVRPCPECDRSSPYIPAFSAMQTDTGFRGGRFHPSVGVTNSRADFKDKLNSRGLYNMDDFGSKEAFSRYCKDRKRDRIEKLE